MSMACRRVAGTALALWSFSGVAEPVRYTIDPTHTFPQFEISHLGFSTHRGRFNHTLGSVVIDRDQKRGEIDIRIEAASIDTGHEALEKILRSDGFFDAEKFPELSFRSTNLAFDGERLTAVHGHLTIKDKTRPISLQIDHFHCGRQLFQPRPICGANATARLLRSDFGIDKYVSFGVGDEVGITLQVEAIADAMTPEPNP